MRLRMSSTLGSALLLFACSGEGSATDANTDATSQDTTGDGDPTAGDGDPTAGDGDPTGDGDCTPELETLRASVFTPSCALAGCHASESAAGGLDLELADLEAQLVGQPSGTCDGWVRVIPGDRANSLLFAKVEGGAPCGDPMPPPGGLAPALAACIGDWIDGLDPLECETCGGDACVDLDADPMHCGACGEVCPDGVPCSGGACVCPEGEELCGGACIDVMSDPDNCGGCGNACGNQVCWMGLCADTCAALTNCDGACVDTQTDPEHCGACNNACGDGNSCEMGGCDCPGDGVSFAAEVEPALVSSCTGAGCHGFPAPAAGLDLRAGFSYAALVGVASTQCNNRDRVAPGQPGNSYLMDKLLGINLCFGTQMPKVGGPLPASDLAAISEWICRGAVNN